jgi:PAS domain S-box-containing protein
MEAEMEKKNNDNFRMLFDQAPLGYQSLDIDGNFLEVNQKWCDTLGYERDEVIGKWFGDFLTPVYKEAFKKNFQIFKNQGHIHSEFEMAHKNGDILFIAFEGQIGNDAEGHFKQTHCILEDITEKKRNEKNLKDALEMLNNAGRTAKFGGWNVILGENRSYWSDEVAAIHEMPTGHCPLVEDGINFYAPEWREKITQVFTDCAQEGIPYDEEMEIITSTGKRVWVRTNGEAVRDDKGIIYKVQGGFQDITERKQNEDKQRETAMMLKTVFDQSPAGSVVVGLDKKFQKCNSAFCKFIGYTEDELIGKTIADITHPEDVAIGMNELKLMSEGKIDDSIVEKRYVRKDGSIVWGEIRISVVRGADNKPLYFLPVIIDITKRKQAEISLINKNNELNEMNSVMIGRELRMIELKNEINKLLKEMGKEEKYEI